MMEAPSTTENRFFGCCPPLVSGISFSCLFSLWHFVVEEKVLPGGVVLLTLLYCTVSSSSLEVSSVPSPSLSSLFVMSQWHNKIFQQTNNVCQRYSGKSLVNHFHLQFVLFRCVPSSTTNGFERHQVQLSNPIHYHLMIAAGT